MIYLESGSGKKVLILETANLEELKKGRPAMTPDGTVVVAWSPDLPWLAKHIKDSIDQEKGGIDIWDLFEESTWRPENPTPDEEPE